MKHPVSYIMGTPLKKSLKPRLEARITEELRRGGMPFTVESTVRRDDLRMSKQQRMEAETRNLAQQRPSTNIGPLVGPSQRPLEPFGLQSQPGKNLLPSTF